MQGAQKSISLERPVNYSDINKKERKINVK